MTVYQDTSLGGHWYACADCRRAGPILGLAASLWGISEAAARARLEASGGLEGGKDSHRTAQPALRCDLPGLWELASTGLTGTQPPAFRQLLTTLRLRHELDRAGLRKEPFLLYGAADVDVVKPYLGCRTESSRHQGRVYHPGGKRGYRSLFQGRGWERLVCVPYWDLPGRVCAFLFVGRNGGAADRVYFRVPGRCRTEFGLAGLPAVLDGSSDVVALADATLMLRLQARHFGVSMRPLPLVSWHDGVEGTTCEAWRVLSDRRVCFWAFELDARTLRQAILANGHVALLGPETGGDATLDHYLRLKTPQDYVRSVLRKARPWQEALEQWTKEATPEAVENLLTDLEATDAHRVLYQAEPRLAEVLRRARPLAAARTTRYERFEYTESADGTWTARAAGHAARRGWENQPSVLVCDAGLRIEEVVMGSAEVRLRGRVRYRGEDLPFEAVRAEIERDPFGFMDGVLVKARKGLLVSATRFKNRIVPVALQLNAPRVVDAG